MVKFAVFGDIHGNHDLMYRTTLAWEQKTGDSIDAVLQVGDFETIRTESDLEHYYAPQRHHTMGDFAGYHDGSKKAPFLTLFIGGNHEAWDVLGKNAKGGFVAPDIYFLGHSGVMEVKGVKVGGLSGVFDHEKWRSQRSDSPSYDWKYFTESDIDCLSDEKLDILLLHNWITPISKTEIEEQHNLPETTENENADPTFNLVLKTKPQYVFMGHKHDSYVRARLGESVIYGLKEVVDGKFNGHSFTVIDVNSTE